MPDDRLESILDPLSDPVTKELFRAIVEQSSLRGYAIVFPNDQNSRQSLDRLVAGGLIVAHSDPIRINNLGEIRDVEAVCNLTDLGKVAASLIAEN